jgi:LuxR family maltose regulon positive regulatory protein
METLDEWLGWFGDEDFRRYPALAVEAAWVHALTGRPAEAERWLALAEGATSTIPLSDGSATIEPWVATLRTGMMPDGVEQAVADADADLALQQLSPDSGWRPAALVLRGAAHALLGATDRATDDLSAAVKAGPAGGAAEVVILAQAQLALLAANHEASGEAATGTGGAGARRERGLGDYSTSALAHVTTARVAIHEARPEDARAALTPAHRLRPLLDHGLPWLTVHVGLELTSASRRPPVRAGRER